MTAVITRLPCALAALAALALLACVIAPPARAAAPPPCGVGSCASVRHGTILSAGKQLLTGHVGQAVTTIVGAGVSSVATSAADIGLGAVSAMATAGAGFALRQTATVIDSSTTPRLASPWFSSMYWRVAGVSTLLTVPFLFAAVIQALLRSDLALLARAALGYLPLAMLGVGVAAQATTLLLAATDELSSAVSGAAGDAAGRFLARAAGAIAAISFSSASPFLALFVAAFTVAGAIVLWLELLIRDAAVQVIVMMLPLVFAAMVWPARRVWAVRAVELLVALIVSKLAIIAVLTLGGATLAESHGTSAWLAGLVLLILGVFAPWAMLRLIPLAEIASGAAGRLRAELDPGSRHFESAVNRAGRLEGWGAAAMAGMRRDAEDLSGRDAPPPALTAGPTDDSAPDGEAPDRSGDPGPGGEGGGGSGAGGLASGAGDAPVPAATESAEEPPAGIAGIGGITGLGEQPGEPVVRPSWRGHAAGEPLYLDRPETWREAETEAAQPPSETPPEVPAGRPEPADPGPDPGWHAADAPEPPEAGGQ